MTVCKETIAQVYVSIGVLEEFAVQYVTLIIGDSLRNIIDLMKVSKTP